MEKLKSSSDVEDDAGSSSSSSSSDTVLISMKDRKKLQQQLLDKKLHESEPSNRVVSSSKKQLDSICQVCEQASDDLVVCTGPCMSSFHLECLHMSFDIAAIKRDSWWCPQCTSQEHRCFHCQRFGSAKSSEGVTASSSPSEAATLGYDTSNDTSSTTSGGLKPVRKCRALSCGKFYHHDCISKLPLARIAGTHFICPLHTCSTCEQSGAKQESVRCMRCPVAYHMNCLPQQGVIHLPGKRIICPKHSDHGHEGTKAPFRAVEKDNDAIAHRNRLPVTELDRDQHGAELSSEMQDPGGASSGNSGDEHDGDEQYASTVITSSSRKHSKSSKREKKKKKKKRKKGKKREKTAVADENEEDSHGMTDQTGQETGKRVDQQEDGSSIDTPQVGESKTEQLAPTPTKAPKAQQAASPLDSLFGSPVKATARIKARLDEVLGQSDDDSVASTPSEKVKENKSEPRRSDEQSPPVAKSEYQAERSATIDVNASRRTQPQDASPIVNEEDSSQCPSDYFSSSQSSAEKIAVQPEKSGRRDSFKKGKSRQALFQSDAVQKVEPESSSGPVKRNSLGLTLNIPEPLPTTTIFRHRSDGKDIDDERDGGASSRSNSVADAGPDSRGGKSSARAKKKKSKTKKSENRRHSDSGVSADTMQPDEHVEEEEEEEHAWVQCDDCKKWRIVASEINLNALPDKWFCHMNSWDKKYASCSVPEEAVGSGTRTKNSRASISSTAKRSKVKGKLKAIKQGGKTPTGSSTLTPTGSAPNQTALTETSRVASVSAPGGNPNVACNVAQSLKKSHSSDNIASKTGSKKFDKSEKPDKTGEKASKKRKLKQKLKEKYREVKWVQCENTQCGKWRVVPSSIDINSLPATWYCHLNTWSIDLAHCNVPNPPDVDTYLMTSQGQTRKASSTNRQSKKPKAADASEHRGNAINAPNHSSGDGGGSSKVAKHGKSSKADLSNIVAPSAASQKLPIGANEVSTPSSASACVPNRADHRLDPVGRVVLEWAQCEKCNKWRKLPHHVKSSSLPDKWYCSMNHWDPARASCSIPEEADVEPVDSSPLPSSQNWYPMPGQFGYVAGPQGAVGGFRSKRGKLSYSELLYANTGQLRKTYTSESSTMSFEYEGRVYHRDDQYRKSSMYVCPISQAERANNEIDSSADSYSGEPSTEDSTLDSNSVQELAMLVLEKLSVRHAGVYDIMETMNQSMTPNSKLKKWSITSVVTALEHLVSNGLAERLEYDQENDQETDHENEQARKKKKKKTSSTAAKLCGSVSKVRMQYRRVPKRPLKASKIWRDGLSLGDIILSTD